MFKWAGATRTPSSIFVDHQSSTVKAGSLRSPFKLPLQPKAPKGGLQLAAKPLQ